jgi:hypothetical protein
LKVQTPDLYFTVDWKGNNSMELIYGLLAGGVAGLVGGYVLATHIHSIADAAASKVIAGINAGVSSIGATPVAAAPAPVVKTGVWQMAQYPTHGSPAAGAGGGNQVASDHISDQHVQADAMTMIGKPVQSFNGVSSTVKPKGLPPSNAGSPVAPLDASGKAPKRSFPQVLDWSDGTP